MERIGGGEELKERESGCVSVNRELMFGEKNWETRMLDLKVLGDPIPGRNGPNDSIQETIILKSCGQGRETMSA